MFLACETYKNTVVYRDLPLENARYICIQRCTRYARISIVPGDPEGPDYYQVALPLADRVVAYLEHRQANGLYDPYDWAPDDSYGPEAA